MQHYGMSERDDDHFQKSEVSPTTIPTTFTEQARQLVERCTDVIPTERGWGADLLRINAQKLVPAVASFAAEAATQGQATGRQAFAAELLGHLDRITSTTVAYHLVRNLCLIELGREPDSTGAST